MRRIHLSYLLILLYLGGFAFFTYPRAEGMQQPELVAEFRALPPRLGAGLCLGLVPTPSHHALPVRLLP